MARKFPDPNDRSKAEPAVLCESHRVKALYNKAHGTSVTRVSKKVSEWFLEEAKEAGWDSAIFLRQAQKRDYAGCVLFKSQDQDVQINLFISVASS